MYVRTSAGDPQPPRRLQSAVSQVRVPGRGPAPGTSPIGPVAIEPDAIGQPGDSLHASTPAAPSPALRPRFGPKSATRDAPNAGRRSERDEGDGDAERSAAQNPSPGSGAATDSKRSGGCVDHDPTARSRSGHSSAGPSPSSLRRPPGCSISSSAISSSAVKGDSADFAANLRVATARRKTSRKACRDFVDAGVATISGSRLGGAAAKGNGSGNNGNSEIRIPGSNHTA